MRVRGVGARHDAVGLVDESKFCVPADSPSVCFKPQPVGE